MFVILYHEMGVPKSFYVSIISSILNYYSITYILCTLFIYFLETLTPSYSNVVNLHLVYIQVDY